jgi:predicted nucleic acid-binding protein
MARERLFLDTSFVVARFYRRDQHHQRANQLKVRIESCAELWTTEAILLEVGAAFCHPLQRSIVETMWNQFHSDPFFRVAQVSGELLNRGMELFRQRADKEWSLTDCVSFVVMQDQQLTDALTCDHHYVQAGFRALLLEESDMSR